MTNKITIKNCSIINEGNIFESDLLIENGRISKINSSIEAQGDVIDASGLYLMPGIIDDQVHFREPGLTERGNIKSESLYRSGISPHNFVKDIEDNSLEKLFISLRNVMKESYLCQGATISTYYDINNEKGKYNFKFLVYGRKTDDEGNIVIKEKTPDGRTSHWVKIKQK